MSANGHLTSAELSPIAGGVGNTAAGEGCLDNDAAAAWNAFAAEALHGSGAHVGVTGPSSAYRSYAMQEYFWHLYQTGQGNLAAVPGSSNHGWGLATDVPMFVIALYGRYGAKYGWGPCSDAPSEWWHRRWCGGWSGHDPGGGQPRDPTPTLRKGSHKHGAVKRAQKHLRRWNVGITQPQADGDFGPTTEAATRQFQITHAMKPDGVIGNATWKQLRRVDHFLNDERWHLNNLRLAKYRRDHGTVSKDTRKNMTQWRKWCAQRAKGIAKVAHDHGWTDAHRRSRFGTLKRASGTGK